MTKFITTQKELMAIVNSAIKSSNTHGASLKTAVAKCFLFAASQVGRFDPLNALMKGVTRGDREAIRQFAMNLMRHHGIKETAENGKERFQSFFTYSGQKMEFAHAKHQNAKAAREIIDDLDVSDLEKIILGKEETDKSDVESVYTFANFEDALSRLIKKALVAGVINDDTAETLNSEISASKRVNRANILAEAEKAESELAKRLEKAKADRARLSDKMETGEKPVPDEKAARTA